MARLIDADALMAHKFKNDISYNAFCGLVKRQPTVNQWHMVEEEMPKDGEWAIFTNGKVVSVERFKEDAYNHFYPASQWFDFEDAIAWMPLPEPPKGDA